MNSPLSQSVRVAAELRSRLAELYSLAEDDEAIDDTISGEVDLPEQVAALARDAIRAESYAKGLAELIKGEQTRKARLDAKADKLRSLISWAMQEAGFKKIPLADMTLSLSAGKRPLVIDEGSTVPVDYLVTPAPVPDKKAIRTALESGEALDFARLGNAEPTLTIRRG